MDVVIDGASTIVEVARSKSVTAREVLDLRAASGSFDGDETLWTTAVEQSMCVVTARTASSGELVGLGFVAGSIRHAQLCDLTVHEGYRGHGIGSAIFDECVAFARDANIRFFGLTWDRSTPWLHPFYERHGFQSVDFAMWFTESLTPRAGDDVWASRPDA